MNCLLSLRQFTGIITMLEMSLYNGVYVVYMANIQYVYTAAHHLMPAVYMYTVCIGTIYSTCYTSMYYFFIQCCICGV